MRSLFLIISIFSTIGLLYAQELQFEEVQDTPFVGVFFSAIEAVDVNGDGRQDIIIAGATKSDQTGLVTKLYMNDCNGNFIEKMDTPFEGVLTGSIDAFDKDSDGDYDLVITGRNEQLEHTISLYENDGKGRFIEIETTMQGVWQGETAVADYDNDGDQDIMIIGTDTSNSNEIASLYLNNGTGNFLLKEISSFIGARLGSLISGDYDNDGDVDIMIIGNNRTFGLQAHLYKNNGNADFRKVKETPFVGNFNGSSTFIDMDNDSDLDIIITGENLTGNAIYINEGSDKFLKKDGIVGRATHTAIAVVDVNYDNRDDVFLNGLIGRMKVFVNDNGLSFTEVANLNLPPVWQGNHIAVADFNNDRTNDFFVVGQSGFDPIAKMYINTTPYSLEDIARSTKMDTLNIDTCQTSYTLPSGRLSLTQSGIYLDTLSSRFGCDSTFFVDVTINQDSYSSINVNSFGCYETPSGLEAFNESGVYYDTIPNAVGCDSILEINLEVLPKDSLVNQDGKMLYSRVAESDSFLWINCSTGIAIQGETDSIFKPKINGDYAVITTTANCSDTSACFSVENLDCVFEVYPNPTREKVKLYLGCQQEEVSISVKNSVGQFIQGYEYQNISELEIDVDHASGGGVYILEITTPDLGTKGLKVIKY